MLRTRAEQVSWWESVLPAEVLRLPEELARVDTLLDDRVFFAPFVPFFDPRVGRPSTPMETYLRMMFLKFRYRLGYESLCAEVTDSITWRRFCRIPLDGTVPHPTTLMKLTTRCGTAAVEGCNEALLAKAHTKDSTLALRKLTTLDGGQRRIISDPPMIVPIEEIFADVQADALNQLIHAVLGKYRRTLQSDRRHLLEQFTLVQVARKVVGVGSVGTRAWIVLMDAGDGNEPLFLQAKEAQPSVLADYCGRSQYGNQGERVVAGQHLQQAQSDIFLGWTRITGPDGIDRDFYVRQLRDWKFSIPTEVMLPAGLTLYAQLCGWTLARAHARSGDRVALAAYLGGSAKFDEAIADFAETYADQNERDYAAFQAAVKDGKAQATTEI